MTPMLISRPAVHVVPDLAGERCDSCGAAAKMTATFGTSGDLSFCGHHAKRYSDRIAATADKVVVEAGFDWRASAEG
ncbi:hypothetical protein ACFFX1_28405 [Dactylosporangium sucinum]|uniref:DUF7455 domain-containing protein n=1 Tax=Dactylosporangium sucinum TaxID=1424081 RepID=A0A917X3G8_9ACTN|nr:hypothetical protein [Dactylosporangium sucinum]GGM60571.1 hypothetical protein GCM10007977_072660 [Dactylosporangium sucinum]